MLVIITPTAGRTATYTDMQCFRSHQAAFGAKGHAHSLSESFENHSFLGHAGPIIMVPRPLPSVLIVHTGGTLGMDPVASYEPDVDGRERLKKGGTFKGTLGPGTCIRHA